MIPITRLQSQLHHSACQLFDVVSVPFFSCYINPDDPNPWSNYAMPDAPMQGDEAASWASAVEQLIEAFISRGRTPRLEYLDAYAPALGMLLERHGFRLEDRTFLMVCTAQNFTPPTRPLPGLEFIVLDRESPLARIQDLMHVQRRAFGDDAAPRPTTEEAIQFQRRFGRTHLLLGLLNGESVTVGSLTQPHDGIAEVAGIATLAAYRKRGLASALTAEIMQAAFAQGLEGLFLTAADEKSGRVYRRVGFRPMGSGVVYGIAQDG